MLHLMHGFADLFSELLLRQAVGHVDTAQQTASGVVFGKGRCCIETSRVKLIISIMSVCDDGL